MINAKNGFNVSSWVTKGKFTLVKLGTHSHRWLAFCDDSKRVVAILPSCIRLPESRHWSSQIQFLVDQLHRQCSPTLAVLSSICDIRVCLIGDFFDRMWRREKQISVDVLAKFVVWIFLSQIVITNKRMLARGKEKVINNHRIFFWFRFTFNSKVWKKD